MNIRTKFLEHKRIILIAGSIVAIGILAGGLIIYASTRTHAQTTQVSIMNLTEVVSTTGTVQANQEVSLSFDQGGRITQSYGAIGDHVSKGQVIVSLDSSDLYAQLAQAQSVLDAANLKLQDLNETSNSSTNTDISSDTQASVQNTRESLANTLTMNYASTEDLLGLNIDIFFTNPTTNPNFGVDEESLSNQYSVIITAPNPDTGVQLAQERKQVTLDMNAWNEANTNLASDTNLASAVSVGQKALTDLQTLATNIATVVNADMPTTVEEQASYTTYKEAIETGLATINATISSLSGANQAYSSAETSVSPYSLQLQNTSVTSAEAQVDLIKAELEKNEIIAPFDGVITEQDAKIGEVTNAGIPLVSLISNDQFQVKATVAESDIAKVKVGDAAQVTLDAYGTGVVFPATVVNVDPGEIITQGAGAYQVTLNFTQDDPRIQSGMTANVDITTNQASGVLVVPTRAIITNGNEKFILIKKGNSNTFTQEMITTGIDGSNGYTEVTSGLSSGETIESFGNN